MITKNSLTPSFQLKKCFTTLAMVFVATPVFADTTPIVNPQNTNVCVPQTCSPSTSTSTPHKTPIHHKKAVHKNTLSNKKDETKAGGTNEKFDPLMADPSISFKDTPPKEIDLPGVLHIKGESTQAFDSSKSHKLSWGNQGIQPIVMSLNGPNLIVMPFNDPRVIGNTYLNIDKREITNNVYVSFQFPEGAKPVPVSIFLEDPAGGPALGLQLIPKKIPQQVYTVVDETDRLGKGSHTTIGADYTTHIQELMETVAFGATPSGYSIAPYNLPPIIIHGLKLDVIRRLSNTEGDFYVYEVSNPTTQVVMLDEKEFDGPRVRAVSIFPKPELKTNEKATVIVFAKKTEAK